MIYDVNINDYPRLKDENSDSKRIMRAIADCERGVLYFPKGIYEIDEMLESVPAVETVILLIVLLLIIQKVLSFWAAVPTDLPDVMFGADQFLLRKKVICQKCSLIL